MAEGGGAEVCEVKATEEGVPPHFLDALPSEPLGGILGEEALAEGPRLGGGGAPWRERSKVRTVWLAKGGRLPLIAAGTKL